MRRRAASLAFVALFVSPLLWAACPDEADRVVQRTRTEHAVAAGASLDAAWGQVLEDARACGEPEAEAQALADWAEAARRHGAPDRLGEIEQMRLAFAEKHHLLRHEAEARLGLALLAIARGAIESAGLHLETALDRV